MSERLDSDDEYNPLGEHVVEIPAHHHALHAAPRRSYATIAVAGFLALAGIAITVGLVTDQTRSARAEAAQRDELRVGWQMLGTLAADDAARQDAANTQVASAQPATNVQQPASPNVVIVNVPSQAAPSAAVSPAPNAALPAQAQQSGAAAPAAVQPQANAAVPVPIIAGVPSGSSGAQPATTTNAAAVANAGQPALPAGATAASSPAQSLPAGSTPASNSTQSLPPGAPGTDLSPVTFPYSQMCGLTTCDSGSVCCNSSCGICAAPGATCSQQAC